MKLHFTSNQIRRQAMRPIRNSASGRPLGHDIDVSGDVTPSLALYPYKLLPINLIDGGLVDGDGLVMVKGTIVSLLTNQTDLFNGGLTPSGIPVPTSSGSIITFDDGTTSAVGDWVLSNVDDDYSGYMDSVVALMVPANGGTQSELRYSALDDTIALWTHSTDGPLIIGSNAPAGVVFQDIYMDNRGAYKSYQAHSIYGIACKGFITVPFVDTSLVTFGSSADTQTATLDTASGYSATFRKYAFLYFNGTNKGAMSGQALTADLNGKFVPQGTGVTTARTIQTVALLKSTDSRFPKQMLDAVTSYTGSKVDGTDTQGIPSILYHFAEDTLTAVNGATPTAATIKAAVRAGQFGLARLSLVL